MMSASELNSHLAHLNLDLTPGVSTAGSHPSNAPALV